MNVVVEIRRPLSWVNWNIIS